MASVCYLLNLMQRKRLLEANIWKYYILRIFVKRLVWPILTIFLVRNALSPLEIGIVFSVGTLIGLVLEVPSGMIADRIGRKSSILIANLGWVMSMAIFWQAESFMGFLIANALYWGVGSLWSGTHEALIYETLEELGRASEIKKVSGRALFISQVTTGVLFVIVPMIAAFSLRLPFLINAIVFIGTCILTLTLVEPKRSQSVTEQEMGKDVWGIKTFFSNHALLATGLFFGLMEGINGILDGFRQVYLDVIHVDIVYFGLIYMVLRLLTGIAGTMVERIEHVIGQRAAFVSIMVISLSSYIGLYLIDSLYGLLFIALDGISSGLARPMEQEFLNRTIRNSQRATLLSVSNLVGSLIRAAAVFLGGVVIEAYGIHVGFLFTAILFIVFVMPVFVWFLRKVSVVKIASRP